MATLYAEIDINAPKEVVWDALVTKERWFYWNTFLFDCDPNFPVEQGEEILLSLRRLPEDEETEFQPLVTLMQSGACLKLLSSLPGFRNEHIFELQEIGLGRTKYSHRDVFTGPLSRFFLPFIRKEERRGIKRMARDLKRYVERSGW